VVAEPANTITVSSFWAFNSMFLLVELRRGAKSLVKATAVCRRHKRMWLTWAVLAAISGWLVVHLHVKMNIEPRCVGTVRLT